MAAIELLAPGDWVQASHDIVEENFMGRALWTHARRGGVGHVIEVLTEALVTVYFERTQTIAVCLITEVMRLGGPDVGIAPTAPSLPSVVARFDRAVCHGMLVA